MFFFHLFGAFSGLSVGTKHLLTFAEICHFVIQ